MANFSKSLKCLCSVYKYIVLINYLYKEKLYRLCFHPGGEFLELGSKILVKNIDDIYFEAIETILWSYATFSFYPGHELLKLLSVKIEKHLCLFTPVHLANMLWCYSLFQFCSSDLWNTIINQITKFRIHEIPAEALFRIYQVSK